MKLVSPGEDRGGLWAGTRVLQLQCPNSMSSSKHQKSHPLSLNLGTSGCNILGLSLAMGGGQGEVGPGVPLAPSPAPRSHGRLSPGLPPSALATTGLSRRQEELLKTENYTQNRRQ